MPEPTIDIPLPPGGRANAERLGNGCVPVTTFDADGQVVRSQDLLADTVEQVRVAGKRVPVPGTKQER